MDSKFVVDVYKNNGINGLIVLLLLLVVGIIAFIVWNELKTGKKKDDSADKLREIEDKLNRHLEKEAQEDIMMAVMNNKQENQENKIVEIKQDVQNIYELMSEIKTLIIQQGQK